MREVVDSDLFIILERFVGPVAVLFQHQRVLAVEALDVLGYKLLEVPDLNALMRRIETMDFEEKRVLALFSVIFIHGYWFPYR